MPRHACDTQCPISECGAMCSNRVSKSRVHQNPAAHACKTAARTHSHSLASVPRRSAPAVGAIGSSKWQRLDAREAHESAQNPSCTSSSPAPAIDVVDGTRSSGTHGEAREAHESAQNPSCTSSSLAPAIEDVVDGTRSSGTHGEAREAHESAQNPSSTSSSPAPAIDVVDGTRSSDTYWLAECTKPTRSQDPSCNGCSPPGIDVALQ